MSYTLGALMVLTAAILFGLQPIYGAKLAVTAVDVNGMMLIRFAVPALLIGFWVWMRRIRLPLKPCLNHACMGIAFGFTGIGYYEAGYQIGFSLAVILFYSFPVIIALYSALIIRIPMQRIQWLAIAVASSGLLLAIDVNTESASLPGIGWALLSASCYAFLLTYKTYYANPLNEWVSLFVLTLTATITVAVYALFTGLQMPNSGYAWQWSLTLAMLAGTVPIALIMRGSPITGASDSATYCLIEPIVAIGVSVALLGESWSLQTIVGGALVIGAAGVLVRKRSAQVELN